jgi:serine protease SohB
MRLVLLLALVVTSIASTAVEPKPTTTTWRKWLPGPVEKEKPSPTKEDEVKPKSSVFAFGRKKSQNDDKVEVGPAENGSQNRNRFGVKRKESKEGPKPDSIRTEGIKKEESHGNIEENSPPKTPTEPASSQVRKEESASSTDTANNEDEIEAQPLSRLFRFGAGTKEKETTIKADSNDGPKIEPTFASPAAADEVDPRDISEEEQRPGESTNGVLRDQQLSKPRRLRFGVSVREKVNVELKNETAKSSVDDKEETERLTTSLEESKSFETSNDDTVESQPAKRKLFRFGADTSENDDNVKSESNVTSVEKEKEVVNVTRADETTQDKPTPLVSQTHGGPMGFPMQPQQPGSGLIIMGLDGRAQRGMPAPRPQPGQPTPTTAIMAEAIATIISTGIRFWFLTSVTRWFADEEIKSLRKPTQHFQWERLNDRHAKDSDALQTALRTPPTAVSERRWRHHMKQQLRKEHQLSRKTEVMAKKGLDQMFDRTVIVVELSKSEKGDFDMTHLEDVVTFILTEHRRKAFGAHNSTALEIEVVVLVESPGGGVSDFGLGAAQIRRLTDEEGIVTTVCVDKVAASGGYMIASQASKVVAAPFAVVGSIGVIREGLNFNKALQKYGILPMVLTAGDAKAPLSTYGEVTKGGLEIAQKNLEKVHGAFRELVVRGRPALGDAIETVADGDIYLGLEALELKLVDEVMTSEEYIMERVQAGDRVLKLHRIPHSMKHRRLASIHPLDFLRENGPRWLAQHDIPKILSRVLQTSTFLKFVQHIVHNRLI